MSCLTVAQDHQDIYYNPIISADYSDPDVIRVGEDYYLVSSSFNMVPGLPVLHSKDLLHWKIVGHGLETLPKIPSPTVKRTEQELDYNSPRCGCGVYAPCIRFHDDFYWIFWADPDAGIYRVKSERPEGPWSPPHLVHEAIGIIDPSPIWDGDTHRAYLSYAFAKSRCGYNSRIEVREMSWDGTHLINDGITVFDAYQREKFPADRCHEIIEGTKFLNRNGFFYIFCPAGSVAFGWQTVLRSRHPMGPYEIRTICESGDSGINGPHQGGLVDTPLGEWWFIHFQDVGTLGRITWLQPSHWHEDWPIVGIESHGGGRPVISHTKPLLSKPKSQFVLAKSDDFSSPNLGLQWQFPANINKTSYSLKKEGLVLHAQALPSDKLEDAGHVISQMFPSACFSVTAKVELRSTDSSVLGGLVALGKICSDLSIVNTGSQYRLALRSNSIELEHKLIPQKPLWLRMQATGKLPLPYTGAPTSGAIQLRYSFSLNNVDYVDMDYTLEAHAGTWIGARWGLFCIKISDADGNFNVMNVDVF